MNWEKLLSNKRLGQEELHLNRKGDRTEFQRDYDRLIFSAPFRRLQNKTQVFPLPGRIFVHNRLTHSLEVASVGRSLGNDTSRRLVEKHPELAQTHISECGAIVSAACLAHDLGNPPFGHSGEKAIGTFFSEGEGIKLKNLMSEDEWSDLIHFEGNANAFRLLTHQFAGRRKGGFVMTYSTLASIVKYPYSSCFAGKKQKFGFFKSEEADYRKIAEELGIKEICSSDHGIKYARHPLVYLVEAADDICYMIMDIEDAHKLKILTTEETKRLMLDFFDEERQKKITSVFNEVTDINEQIVYLRSCVIGLLERHAVDIFIENEERILEGEFTGSLISHIKGKAGEAYKACSKVAIDKIYQSKDVVDIELAGYKIISTLLELFIEAAIHPEKAYSQLLLRRVSSQYEVQAEDIYARTLAILDLISGMTDVYALELYRKIRGESIPII